MPTLGPDVETVVLHWTDPTGHVYKIESMTRAQYETRMAEVEAIMGVMEEFIGRLETALDLPKLAVTQGETTTEP